MSVTIPLTLEFGGGMELLFQNRKSIQIEVPVPESGVLRIRELLPFIRDSVKPERPELFMQEDTIFVNSLSSPRSQNQEGSSSFSSPVPFKRAKLGNEAQRKIDRSRSETKPTDLFVDLDEIYRNNRRCPEIEKNLKGRKWRMASFRATIRVAEIIFTNWEDTLNSRNRKQQFSNYVVGFVMRVGPSVATLLHALMYTIKLREIYPRARGEQGCAHRLFVVSLLVSARYLNDRQILIKPNHITWSTLSGVFTAPELERMEMEFVTFLRGSLFLGKSEMERCVEESFFEDVDDAETALIVPGSVDWLELISVKAKFSTEQTNKDVQVP